GEGLHSAAGSHCGRPLRVRHGGGHEDEEKTTDHKNELAHERASFARPELRPCGGDGGATRVPRAKPRSFRARSCGARSCVWCSSTSLVGSVPRLRTVRAVS